MMEEIIEGVKHISQKREQKCAVEHIVDVPVPRIREGIWRSDPARFGRTNFRSNR